MAEKGMRGQKKQRLELTWIGKGSRPAASEASASAIQRASADEAI